MEEKTREIIEKINKYVAHNYLPIPVVLSCGRGVWVWDVEGNRYIDMVSCYSAISAGYKHKYILRILVEQSSVLSHCSRAFFSNKLGEYAELLCNVCNMEVMLPMNTGAEAVETAIKIARKWGYKKKKVEPNKAEIIVCDNNFHGRTVTIIGFSSEDQYRDGFSPFTPGFVSIPFGDTKALENAITKNTVAFLVEPIQGEAGIVVPPDGFLREASIVCRKNNVLFVADEVQTGLGRTGRIFACDHEKVQPDMYILGKALGGGVSIVSAVVSNWNIMDVIQPGDHGSTFGGGPLSCAVAEAYLNVMLSDNYASRAEKLGSYFIEMLKNIKSPHVKEVRGRGLLIGIELNKLARPFCEGLMEEGVLSKETHDYVIRLAPPLIISKEEIDWTLKQIKKVLTK